MYPTDLKSYRPSVKLVIISENAKNNTRESMLRNRRQEYALLWI